MKLIRFTENGAFNAKNYIRHSYEKYKDEHYELIKPATFFKSEKYAITFTYKWRVLVSLTGGAYMAEAHDTEEAAKELFDSITKQLIDTI